MSLSVSIALDVLETADTCRFVEYYDTGSIICTNGNNTFLYHAAAVVLVLVLVLVLH